MKKELKTIGAYSIIEFDNRMNEFLKELGHYKIIGIQYFRNESDNQYIAFILHQTKN